jgi:hypothetical protein
MVLVVREAIEQCGIVSVLNMEFKLREIMLKEFCVTSIQKELLYEERIDLGEDLTPIPGLIMRDM